MKLPPWGALLPRSPGDDGPDLDDPSGIVRLALGSEALITAYAQASGSTVFVIPSICGITAMALLALVSSRRPGL